MASWTRFALLLLVAGFSQANHGAQDSKHGSPSSFAVLHTPSYVSFSKDAGPLPAKEVGAMAAYALGLAPNKGLTWDGLMPGSLFRRPKANVMFVVDGVPSGSSLGLKGVMQTALAEDGSSPHHSLHAVSSGKNLASHVSDLFHGKSLSFSLCSDHQIAQHADAKEGSGNHMFWNAEKKVFTAVSSLTDGPFSSLPLAKLSEQLQSFAWPKGIRFSGSSFEVTLEGGEKVTLDLNKKTDAQFLAELGATMAVRAGLTASSGLVADNIPDVLTFTLSGLKALHLHYGANSAQVKAAMAILRSFLPVIAEEFSKLYHGDAIIEVIQVTFNDKPFHQVAAESDLRKVRGTHDVTGEGFLHTGRHLLSASERLASKDNATAFNLAFEHPADWSATFTMILFLLVILILALLAISYVLWTLDPGYDSVIYRMTNQRIKME